MIRTLDELAERLSRPGELERQRRFEEAAIASGLPWRTPAASLAAQYGVGRWRDFQDAVFLPVPGALGLDGARFFFVPDPHARQLPPRTFQTDFNGGGGFRRNHEHATAVVTGLAGEPPENRDTSNCLCAAWRIGALDVELFSFLPDSTRSKGNALYAAHPDLADSTLVYANAMLADREPDPSLVDSRRFDHIEIAPGEASIGYGAYERNRLLPAPARQTDAGQGCRVWKDGGRFGAANGWLSTVLPRAGVEALLHEEITPGRGGGRSEIAATGQGGRRLLTLVACSRWDGLRTIAARLGKLLRLEVRTESFPDE